MKERVEAAFVAQEQDNSNLVSNSRGGLDHSNSSTENNGQNNSNNVNKYQEDVQEVQKTKQNTSEIESSEREPELERNKIIPTSEESSNDTDETDAKLKNAVLRNCFASLYRRQKIEKEQEYNQYLNGLN